MPAEVPEERIATGVPGLDEVLDGGLLPRRAYLIRGGPGVGKTILGLHFLAEGACRGEVGLYVNLGEPEAQVRRNADQLGIDIGSVSFLDLAPTADFFTESLSYDIFSPAEVEREPVTQSVLRQVRDLRPTRVFLDAMTQFRYLSPDQYQFRRQMLSLIRFLTEEGATVVFSSEASTAAPDDELQYMADGILNLTAMSDMRGLSVIKLRGSDFRAGQHTYRLGAHGMVVFPRLLPEAFHREFVAETIASGVPELDELLHGGLERGTVTLVSGPNGVGKTTLGMQFMKEAAGRGERSVIYAFEESADTLMRRSQALNMPVAVMVKRGTLVVTSIEPLHYTADEFVHMVRQEVEQKQASIVMIDSISGYRLSLRGEDLVTHLHALCKYLVNMGVTVILVAEVESIIGSFRATEYGISYLADNIVFLRYLEIQGELRKAIGVLKKRLSDFEKSLRQFEITRYGIKVGEPLTDLRGILSGTPEFVSPSEAG
ncbi:MAG: ATPase domain-containing protein [Anaerolineae bacterium]